MSESQGAGHAGRVALVTGGAAGIGRAEAIALAEAGADVAVLGHADLDGAEETARRCRALGRRAVVVQADVRWSDEVRRAVDEVVHGLGRLDILVNNAGALGAHLNVPLLELDESTWHLMLDSHLTGTFLCIKHAAPHMVRQRWGRVINTSSVHGRNAISPGYVEIKIKPPLVIDEGEVETVLGVLADCLKVVFPVR
jgi:NAD(P)-dependent dehydrogenase (short-subunit alcohol dehydrogenase family)